jgi:hypothetical protein
MRGWLRLTIAVLAMKEMVVAVEKMGLTVHER